VYVYTKSGGTFTKAADIALNHYPAGSIGSARNKGVGIGVQPRMRAGSRSRRRPDAGVVNNYNDSISVIDTASRTVRYEHDLRPFFANNEGRNGGVGGTFPYASRSRAMRSPTSRPIATARSSSSIFHRPPRAV
jgi:hypothetical protein